MKNECQELVNIKYQTMLLNNNKTTVYKKQEDKLSNMEMFLEKEKETNINNPWSKLSKTEKLKKIESFTNDYSIKKKLSNEEKIKLNKYLKTCLERKKLQRVKDVEYDIKSGKIKNIVGLSYSKTRNKFTLKNRMTKPSSLRTLAPKKNKTKNKTKNKIKTRKIASGKEKAKEKAKEKTKKQTT